MPASCPVPAAVEHRAPAAVGARLPRTPALPFPWCLCLRCPSVLIPLTFNTHLQDLVHKDLPALLLDLCEWLPSQATGACWLRALREEPSEGLGHEPVDWCIHAGGEHACRAVAEGRPGSHCAHQPQRKPGARGYWHHGMSPFCSILYSQGNLVQHLTGFSFWCGVCSHM